MSRKFKFFDGPFVIFALAVMPCGFLAQINGGRFLAYLERRWWWIIDPILPTHTQHFWPVDFLPLAAVFLFLLGRSLYKQYKLPPDNYRKTGNTVCREDYRPSHRAQSCTM